MYKDKPWLDSNSRFHWNHRNFESIVVEQSNNRNFLISFLFHIKIDITQLVWIALRVKPSANKKFHRDLDPLFFFFFFFYLLAIRVHSENNEQCRNTLSLSANKTKKRERKRRLNYILIISSLRLQSQISKKKKGKRY